MGYTGIWLINVQTGGESEQLGQRHMEFGVDSVSNVANLPKKTDNYKGYGYPAPWSLAKVAETGDIYYLDRDSDTWKKVGT